jgi:hypothetical protein
LVLWIFANLADVANVSVGEDEDDEQSQAEEYGGGVEEVEKLLQVALEGVAGGTAIGGQRERGGVGEGADGSDGGEGGRQGVSSSEW